LQDQADLLPVLFLDRPAVDLRHPVPALDLGLGQDFM